MRTKPFTFVKTKRIKTVTEHKGICVDLTVQEAADLAAYLKPAQTPDCRFTNLLNALEAFCEENNAKSDLSNDPTQRCFRMVTQKEAQATRFLAYAPTRTPIVPRKAKVGDEVVNVDGLKWTIRSTPGLFVKDACGPGSVWRFVDTLETVVAAEERA